MKFDRYSGSLLNIADSELPVFYKLPSIKRAIKDKTHPCLCLNCLVEEYPKDVNFKVFKFKNGKWMTSNLAILLRFQGKLTEENVQKMKSLEKCGVLPYKKTQKDWERLKEDFGIID